MSDSQASDVDRRVDSDDQVGDTLGGEFLGGLDPLLLLSSLSKTVDPAAAAQAMARVASRTSAIMMGTELAEPPARDPRFRDPAFQENPFFRNWAQAYLVWEEEMMRLVDNDAVDWRTRERSRMLMTALTTAAAPTNVLVGNPEAIKKAVTTGGRSLMTGAGNFIRDLLTNQGLPAQVDRSAFKVGVDVAATPGWVISRTEMFELIHYAPVNDRVGTVPLLLLPPAVNKYYFWDISPGRSFIEYAVGRGVDVYTIVWRDPKPEHAGWGVDSYLGSALEAVAQVCSDAGVDDVHVFGDCSGGMFLDMLLAHQVATGRRSIRTGTMGVTVVDFGEPGGIGIAASDEGLETLRRRAERGEIISADSIASTFIWMRPNDLVWRYLVDEWLLGNEPAAFDIMFWNADGQGLTAQLAYELTKMSLENSLIEPGGMTALGEPIDLSRVDVDTYHIAGRRDHISPWKACYHGARVLGGDRTFVLTPTGHVQSIIYPPDKPRASFLTGPELTNDPDAWIPEARKVEGSWWPHWADWLLERSEGTRPAPVVSAPSDLNEPAPGRYVLGD